MSEINKPFGVVVGKPQGKAILYTAIKEGLVDNNPTIGDGYIGRILAEPPLADVRDSAYEQLVIGGKVYLPFWIPNDWRGAIFDNKLVEPLPWLRQDEKIVIESLSDSTIINLLRDRGYNYTFGELQQYRDDFFKKQKEWEDIANGQKYSVVYSLYDLYNKYAPGAITIEQYNKSVELVNAHEKIYPIEEILDEYSSIITYSLKTNAYSSLPIEDTLASNLSFFPARDFHQKQALLQVSCDKLNAAPIGHSLKQTIEISQSDETIEYRSKLDEWVGLLKNGNPNDYSKVIHDIQYSLKQLEFSKFLNRSGNFLTYIGVPMSILGLINPIISISGIAFSIVGAIGLGSEKYINSANRWAMFGLRRK